jgi:hypothetical protein
MELPGMESSRVGIGICGDEWMSTRQRRFCRSTRFGNRTRKRFLNVRDGKARADGSPSKSDEHGWDFVPYPDARLEEVFGRAESLCNS